jgi:biopolymer transport protein ExbB
MFENKSLLDVFQMGGWVMYLLLACSVLSVAVFVGKEIEFWKKSKPERTAVMRTVRGFLERKEIDGAIQYCGSYSQSIFCRIIGAGLAFYGKRIREIEDAVNREITVEIEKLEKRTIIVGTIANIAVYIGLFGTVIGIVNAFHGIASSGSAGLNSVIAGVAEALLNTAMGLAVAIPAVIFFNWMMKQIKTLTHEMDAAAGELLIILDAEK